MTAENRIHVALMLALAAANLAVVVCGPFESALSPAEAARSARNEPFAEASRAEIESAIHRLQSWLGSARSAGPAGHARELALQGLGPLPEDRAQPGRWLARVLGTERLAAWLAPTRDAAAAAEEDRRAVSAALVILLESGIPLDQPVSAAPAEKTPSSKLSELVQRALDAAPAASAEVETEPERLDLLSLAVLGGMDQYREALARATHDVLRRLDRAHRQKTLARSDDGLQPQQLAELARTWRGEASEPRTDWPLRCSAAVFRATAVLEDADLEEQARRHLAALLFRYRDERQLYRYLEARARDARERQELRVQALENLGRLEEALYNAHLSFRSDAAAPPAPETARVMRLAARDLIQRLETLEAQPEAPAGADRDREALLRAAVHALRGLRTARLGAS